MAEYELLYIISGDKPEDAVTKVTDEVNAALMKIGGTVDNENFWGRRRLAYPINRQDHGWYVIMRFSVPGTKLSEFQNGLRLNQDIVRQLVISAADVPTAEEAEKTLEAVSQSVAKDEQKAAEKAAPKKPVPEEAAKPVKPVDEKVRKAQLEEKLGEILKD